MKTLLKQWQKKKKVEFSWTISRSISSLENKVKLYFWASRRLFIESLYVILFVAVETQKKKSDWNGYA